jgi:ketosteroid isomerase-like protein
MGEGSAAVLVAERDGSLHRWNAVHWWRLRDGKLAALHEFVDDPAAFGRAWHG